MAHKDKEQRRKFYAAYYLKNRERARLVQKAWRDSPRGAAYKFNRTLKKHGISKTDWDSMWEFQRGKCAGCESHLEIGQDTHIDHCHSSDRVRGLLCSSCNLALGKVKDCAATLRRLAAYLERSAVRRVA